MEKETKQIIRQLIGIIDKFGIQPTSTEDAEIIEQARVQSATFDDIKGEIFKTNSIPRLNELVEKYSINASSYLGGYVRRRVVWIAVAEAKKGTRTRESATGIFKKYLGDFLSEGREKVEKALAEI